MRRRCAKATTAVRGPAAAYSPDLHDAIRRRAAEQGLTVRGYVLELVRRDRAVPSQKEWFAELAGRQTVERADILGALDAARAAHDAVLL
jgi:hypothetical protein